MPITVALIEGNVLLRQEMIRAIATDPACRCVFAAADWKADLRSVVRAAPEVIVMEADPDGIVQLKSVLPQAQLLVCSAGAESERILAALRAGASGYLLRPTSGRELLEAIRGIRQGGVPMSADVARKVLQVLRRGPGKSGATEHLTAREQEILELLAEGCLSREIAQRLSISLDTVNTHLKHIYDKMQVRSRTEAVIRYLTHAGP
ncbi:MAG TPA: response regulator transcription factor [Opitutaceae bacterium]|nr:response regulator transcription factor [Opitutaceae bacterium]